MPPASAEPHTGGVFELSILVARARPRDRTGIAFTCTPVISSLHMNHVDCLVLIPAGPATVLPYLDDTIASVNHHVGVANCRVVVLDDTRRDQWLRIADRFPNAVSVKAPDYSEGTQSRTRGALFAKQVYALKWMMERYRFDIFLRMDTDAIMIGDAPHEDALAFLKQQPNVGMVGAFRRRGDGSDKTQAMLAKGRELTGETALRFSLKDLALAMTLRRLLRQAQTHGYTPGDMCTGGAYFLSPRALVAMQEQGLFNLKALERSRLPDDALMALLCCAAGFRLSDLPEERDVLAINWRGMPMPPEVLVSRNKKIVHPIKDDDPTVEPAIRAYFQGRRAAATASASAPVSSGPQPISRC